jgi:N-acetyl-1-D-myo-inositol-2-amino-2-deoxy-alpha-D-glucopyranoside deacetylase
MSGSGPLAAASSPFSNSAILDTALLDTVLFVHAHPDDETLSSGALIRELVASGVRVVLLTATRGEQGEVVAAVRHTVPSGHNGEPDPAALTLIRLDELAGAVRSLGIADAVFLGEPPARASGAAARRYLDSGMRWLDPDADGRVLAGPALDVDDRALTAAPLAEVSADVLAYLRQVQPDLVVSYDDIGGYGHPDHRRAREAALAAAREAGVPFAEIVPPEAISPDAPDARLVDATPRLAEVQDALRHHATQLTVDGADVVHSGGQREPIRLVTGLRLVP